MSDADAGRMPPPAEDRAAGDTTATIARLERRALREREARRQAEALLETRSLELYEANQALTRLAGSLEEQVEARTREMESAVLRANEAVSAKTNFLATMSHELRTPMNGVIGAVQLLLDAPLAPEQQAHAETIRASGELLLSIINDILDLSKIDAGRLVLESRPFDPRRSLASIDSLMRPTAGARGIDFDVRVDPALPARLVGDDMRLRQVMLNLVSNAVKFTSQGGVGVRLVAGLPDAEGWLPVEFTVEDTGIGIPAYRLETVFEPFTQADASTAREYGGTGLGLAICRRIAGLMRGSLEVESIYGQGSVFRMSWRAQAAVAQAVDAEPAPVSTPASPGDTRSLRVLVVEDNEINRTIACALLARLGLDAEVAEDGEVALEKVVCGRYDLVLMDMRMPRMDGLESTRRMRALPLARQPRVFALTANAFEEDRQACLAAGMDGFLAKPYRLEQLAGVVADVRAWLRGLDPA